MTPGLPALTALMAGTLTACTEPTPCAAGFSRVDGYCLPDAADDTDSTDPAPDSAAPDTGDADDDTGSATEDPPDGMVRVPATTATLGCVASDPWCFSALAWDVAISHDLWVDETEVTRAEWAARLGDRTWDDDCGDDCPASGLTWYEAALVANARSRADGLTECYTCQEREDHVPLCVQAMPAPACDGYRMPTEAEWEVIARCGTDLPFAGSDDPNAVGWTDANSGGVLHPVAQLAPNACGLFDLTGNAWEWTQDWYVPDEEIAGGTDPLGGVTGNERVARGGAYDFDDLTATVHFRDRCRGPEMSFPNQGVRLVRAVPAGPPRPGVDEAVRFEAGTFTLGCTAGQRDCAPDEAAHTVTLTRAFQVDVAETTQARYRAWTGESPARFAHCGDDCPVEHITWHMAAAAANARSALEGLPACYTCDNEGVAVRCAAPAELLDCAGYRLPTEAEWEVAARCGADDPWPGADRPDWVAWTRETAGEQPHPVGALLPNACGLVDMGGNVSEWVHDGYGAYPDESTDPLGADEDRRGTRGGNWVSDPDLARTTARRPRMSTDLSSAIGMRLVRTVD